jgi:hypothetical protein
MFRWIHCNGLYGQFFWKYACRNDMDNNIRIGTNWLQFVEYEEKGDEAKLED